MAVTAFTNADIVSEGFKKLGDYAGKIPALSYATREPGGTTVIMRGCATSGISFSKNPTTSIYLDEQPITAAGTNPDPRLIDIKRIEALSGPQGTLFGDASECGTLRIITNKPDVTGFAGWVDGTVSQTQHGGTGYDFSAMANIPLVPNTLALRLVGFYTDEAGFIDNILGTSPGGTFTNSQNVKNNVNDSKVWGGRAALRWTPTDNWKIDLQGTFQKTNTNGFSDRSLSEQFLANNPGIGDLQQVRFNNENWDDKWYQLSVTAEGNMGMFDVTMAGSFMNRKIRYQADSTAYLAAFNSLHQYLAANTYYTNIYDFGDVNGFAVDRRNTDRWTFETRIATADDLDSRWSGIVGFFYNNLDSHETFTSNVRGFDKNCTTYYAAAPGCNTAFTYLSYLHYYYFGTFSKLNNNWFTGIYHDRIEQKAVFGEIGFDVTDNFKITVGGRWYDVNSFTLRTNGPSGDPRAQFAPLNDPNLLICATPAEQSTYGPGNPIPRYVDTCLNNSTGRSSESGFVPKVNATYHFDRNKLVYFTYSEGFRQGGVNAARAGIFSDGGSPLGNAHTFKSDSLDNYELGLKSTWLNNSLQVNLTGYHMVWNNMQIQAVDPNPVYFASGIINLREATIDGVEGMVAWIPAEGWNLDGNFGYNDATLSKNVNKFGVVLNKGDRLPLTPKWKSSLTVKYTFQRQLFGMTPNISGTWAYQGESLNSLNGVATLVITNPPRKQHSYNLLNLRASLEGNKWTATFFIDNITNEHAELFFNDRWVQTRQSVNRPRTFGLNIRRSFGK
jgi:iron complex outermembrane receptor protein